MPSLNRGFSAPVRLIANIGDKDLRFLAVHDRDPFNRWQAVHSIATHLLVDSTAAVRRERRAARGSRPDRGAHRRFSTDRELEPAFVAQVIALPSEADIAREIASNVDPDAVFGARLALRRSIAASLQEVLAETYERLAAREPYSPDAEAAGRRALKNVCLDLLTASGDAPGHRARHGAIPVRRQHDRSHGRAHRAVVARRGGTRRALDDFYARYSNDPLIVDKWLCTASRDSRAGDARARQGADCAFRVFDVESQSRARADRSLRDVEPEGIQPRRRWRL